MKNLILASMLTLTSLNCFASTEISRVKDKSSQRMITYSQDGSSLIFTLSINGIETEIKRLEYDISDSNLKLAGDQDVYNFDFYMLMKNTTSKAYSGCFEDGLIDIDNLGFAIIPAIPLCLVLPAMPFLVGVAALPIDGAIGIGDKIFDVDTIASKKFNKLISGVNISVSKKVFNSMVEQIKSL